MSKITQWNTLDTFTIESGKVNVSDPCYHEERNEGIENHPDVKKGQWTARVAMVDDEDSYGGRNALLIAHHVDHPIDLESATWVEMETGVGVESGQAGIFDAHYFGDESVVDEEIENPLTGENKWYDLCCAKTTNEIGAGVIPYGCVSCTGLGDGFYKVYSHTQNDAVVAVAIDFDMLPPIHLLPEFSEQEAQLFAHIKDNKIDEAIVLFEKNKEAINAAWFLTYCLHKGKDDLTIALAQTITSGENLDLIPLIRENKKEVFKKMKPNLDGFNDAYFVLKALYSSQPADAMEWSQLLVDHGLKLDESDNFLLHVACSIDDDKLDFLKFWAEQGLKLKDSNTDWDSLTSLQPGIKKYLRENAERLV